MDMNIPQAIVKVPASTGAEPAGEATEYFFSEQLSAFFDREQHAMWLRWNPTPRPNFNPDLLRDLGVMLLALVAYGALFALLGVLLKRPVIPGLLFLYGWELLANLPGYLPRLTLTAWLRSLIHHRPAEEGIAGLFQQVLPADQALVVLLGVSLVLLAAAGWIFSTREYVLEQ